MPLALGTATAGLTLALGIAVVTVLLGAGQWYERRQRETNLSPEDAHHFARQDLRRALGTLVLLLLALGIAIGSGLPPKLAGRTNPAFVRTWLGAFLLIFVLLGLALLDWLATRHYACRHRRILAQEGIAIVRDEARRRSSQANGRAHPRTPPSH